MDDETKRRVEFYTDWLQEWAKDLPGQITIAANRTPYQWAIYRGDPPEKVGVLHPTATFWSVRPLRTLASFCTKL